MFFAIAFGSGCDRSSLEQLSREANKGNTSATFGNSQIDFVIDAINIAALKAVF